MTTTSRTTSQANPQYWWPLQPYCTTDYRCLAVIWHQGRLNLLVEDIDDPDGYQWQAPADAVLSPRQAKEWLQANRRCRVSFEPRYAMAD